ncbi:MAG: FAD-dependent oxidoreductase [Verrucomicrobia bacterium]|nr:FAD-dependent oxidoreductase [Verrucomicrobiota bacterium]MBU1733925.1 FAD-dependent oxidoreductase [Verrucomicrobiota bacterium]MBU1857279.1 FAD-dependent oxidoreductase [Verrucomicrobiota bacterium]
MRKADVIIIGGSAAGATAAITARRHYPEKEVFVVRQEKQVSIPCGIPYIFGTLGSASKNIIPDAMLEKEGVKIAVETVKALDVLRQTINTTEGVITYERLILATGSLPGRLPVPGFDKDGAFPILKDIAHLEALQKRLQSASNVVVIGCGFIGIEFADEIRKLADKKVTVLEIAPYCLSLAYDEEFCVEMQTLVRSRGIDIRTHAKVAEIQGNGRVESVRLSDGTAISADVVIFGVGAIPNVEIAKAAGIKLGPTGAIAVDRAMKTSNENIFACGDCAEKISFFGGRPSPLRLASIATLEARIAGANLYSIRREHDGTVGVWSTAVGGLAMATAGLTETAAKQNGYDCVAVVVEGPNRHPGGMPGGAPTKLKLVFEKNTGVLLGGQVRGNESAGEIINTVSACIQKRMLAEDIATFQMGTHPALTASPIAYPLVNAAEIAISQMRKTRA